MKLGPTNEFPLGKLNKDDEGGLRIAIGIESNVVKINFGSPVAWVGLPKQNAIDFANTILKHAEKL